MRDNPLWKSARAALDRYRELAPAQAADALPLESNLLWLEALAPYDAGKYEEAGKLFARALELDPDNLRAAALLGQCEWWLGRYRAGLALLERALARHDDPSFRGKREPAYYTAILVWILGNAAKAPDAEAFVRARERFLGELDQGTPFEKEELLSAAEFLGSLPPRELLDCESAYRLIEENDFREAFEGTTDATEMLRILDAIDKACK